MNDTPKVNSNTLANLLANAKVRADYKDNSKLFAAVAAASGDGMSEEAATKALDKADIPATTEYRSLRVGLIAAMRAGKRWTVATKAGADILKDKTRGNISSNAGTLGRKVALEMAGGLDAKAAQAKVLAEAQKKAKSDAEIAVAALKRAIGILDAATIKAIADLAPTGAKAAAFKSAVSTITGATGWNGKVKEVPAAKAAEKN